MALVQFERGWKVRHDAALKVLFHTLASCLILCKLNLQNGITKCREAIYLTLGKSTPKKIDLKAVKLVVQEMKLERDKESSWMNQRKSQKPRQHKDKLKLTARRVLSANHKMLGKMDVDAVFLENFLKQQTWRQKQEEEEGDGNEFVNTLASDALKFLEERKHFWEQTTQV